ncbi:MAG: hypothetical protein RIC36_14355 [Rhodospirillales bacterium]
MPGAKDGAGPLRPAMTIAAALLLYPFAATGQTFDFSGYIAGDFRVFPVTPADPRQDNQHLNPSLAIAPEVVMELDSGNDIFVAKPFFRYDYHDAERTHGDLRELKWLHIGDGWDMRAGIDKVFWGVTESRHLVDIINQTDSVEDVDGEDKLGQPMINLGLQQDWGNLNFLFMPYFRERSFPGPEGRLRSQPAVDADRASYTSGAGRWHPDLALRYSTSVDEYDLGLSWFRGTSREPTFSLGTNAQGDAAFIPSYDVINQAGLDLQATFDAWLWKLESIYRWGQADRFAAASAGVEYTFFGAISDAGDLGLLTEFHYDGRNGASPAAGYDHDLFLGARITLNDVDDTDFLGGVLIAPTTGKGSLSIEADTRLTDHWTAELEIRLYRPDAGDPQFGARRDHHLQLRLARYF